jgi:hypothetical protein
MVAGSTFFAMALLYVLFAKVVPIISIWELKGGGAPHGHPAPHGTTPRATADGRRLAPGAPAVGEGQP